jgi:adenylate kinase family enzyme
MLIGLQIFLIYLMINLTNFYQIDILSYILKIQIFVIFGSVCFVVSGGFVMINIVTGAPGAGKTYLAVKLLIDDLFFWHKKDKQYYRKSDKKKYTIFTNINGFKLDHKDLNEIFKDKPFEEFFTPEYQKKVHEKYPHVIYVLDEVQQYLPTRFRNTNCVLYFDTHRHYGDKIWLISQDLKKITKDVTTLMEQEYRAVKSTFRLLPGFQYNIKSGGEIFKRIRHKADKRIFNVYKSFTGDDQQKFTNPVKWLALAFVCGAIFLGYYFIAVFLPDNMSSHEKTIQDIAEKNNISGEKKTYFVDEGIRVQIDEIEKPKELDLDKLRSIRIKSKVIKDNMLYAFEDPVTGKWLFHYENPYIIKNIGFDFYIVLTLRQHNELTKQHEIFNPLS